MSPDLILIIAERRPDYSVTPEESLDDSCCQVPLTEAGIVLSSSHRKKISKAALHIVSTRELK
jgi:hypothetical protein